MISHLQTLTLISIVVALACLGAAALTTVIAALRVGGRREEPPDSYEALSASRFTIPVSIVVPVEGSRRLRSGATRHPGQNDLSDTINSLLALDYPDFEVIVVAEQLTDEDLGTLKIDWALEPKEFFYRQSLGTTGVRRIYRSSREPRVMVVEKERASQADALNCGVNLARYRYIVTVTSPASIESDALLRAMGPALRDPGNAVAIVCHLESAGDDFERLKSLRAIMASRIAWRWLRAGLALDQTVVIWRRDALLQRGGFANGAADPCLDMMVRLQVRPASDGNRVVRTAEIFGRAGGQTRARRLRVSAKRPAAAFQALWRNGALAESSGLDGRAAWYFAASELLAPLLEAWVGIGTLAGAILGWLSWTDALLALLVLSLGHALVTTAALLLRGAAPGAPTGHELLRLVFVAPFEFALAVLPIGPRQGLGVSGIP